MQLYFRTKEGILFAKFQGNVASRLWSLIWNDVEKKEGQKFFHLKSDLVFTATEESEIQIMLYSGTIVEIKEEQ